MIYRIVELLELDLLLVGVLLCQLSVKSLVQSFQGVEAPWLLVEEKLQVVGSHERTSRLKRCRSRHPLLCDGWFCAQLDVCGWK